ncbi:MAG: NnrS family protein [Rubrivivax sp.]|nr:NnrS family protein [Rubrivivax sp.]
MTWSAAHLLSAPHRLGFFAGAAGMAASALWWGLLLLAMTAGLASPPWTVPPPLAHGLVFAFGFMPLFITGFLFTAGPRWLALRGPPARELLAPVLAMAAGWALAVAGFHGHEWLAAAGVALAGVGWATVAWRFAALLRASRERDLVHARAVTTAAAVGVAALALAATGLATAQWPLVRAATLAALWGFLGPVFASVSHRMLPVFDAVTPPALTARWPFGLLAATLAALACTAAFEAAQALWWPLPAAAHAALAAVQAAAALLLLWLARRWARLQNLRNRLLAMLFGGFVWLGVAFALGALSHARVAAFGEEASLGLAPLHALAAGYLGTTLFAMATRVSAGHSGRPVAADDVAWVLYWLAQAAALLRVGSALWSPSAPLLLPLAACAWAAACTGWALRYGRWLGSKAIENRRP